eukprot:gene14914-biopygen15701
MVKSIPEEHISATLDGDGGAAAVQAAAEERPVQRGRVDRVEKRHCPCPVRVRFFECP